MFKIKRFSKLKAGLGIAGGAILLSLVKPHRLSGIVTRYHNTDNENVPNILEEGIKSSYAEDPKNLTNLILKKIPKSKKKGLVYLSKNKELANSVGARRAVKAGKLLTKGKKSLNSKYMTPEDYRLLEEEELNPKLSKTLKLHFKYNDIKKLPREENPELEGNKTPEDIIKSGYRGVISKEVAEKYIKALNEDTHTYRGDIGPEHIKESKHYKPYTIEDWKEYVKENPKRFGKEALKTGSGAALLAYGIKHLKKKKK